MYTVMVENSGGSEFKISADGHEFRVDTQGSAVKPLSVLLSGLGACIGVYTQRYFDGAKLGVKGFKVSVSGDLNLEKPVRFRDIKVSIDLEGVSLDDQRKEALLRFVKNCPAHNTLEGKPDIKIEVA